MRPGGSGVARGGPAGPRRARGGAASTGRGGPAGRVPPPAAVRGGGARVRSGARLGAPGREAVDLGSRIVRVDPLQVSAGAPRGGGAGGARGGGRGAGGLVRGVAWYGGWWGSSCAGV